MNKTIVTIFFVVLLVAFAGGGFFIFKSSDIQINRSDLFPPTGGANSENFDAPLSSVFTGLNTEIEKEGVELAAAIEQLAKGERPNLNINAELWNQKTIGLQNIRVSSTSACRFRPPTLGAGVLADQLAALKAGTQNVVIIPNLLSGVCLVRGGDLELVSASSPKGDITVADHGLFRIEGILELDQYSNVTPELAELFGVTRRGLEMWLSLLTRIRPGFTTRIIVQVSKVDPPPADARPPVIAHAQRLVYSMAGDLLALNQFLTFARESRRDAIVIDVRDAATFTRDRAFLSGQLGSATLLNIPVVVDAQAPAKLDVNTALTGAAAADWGQIQTNFAMLAFIGDNEADVRALMAMKSTFPQPLVRPFVIQGGVEALRR